MDEGLPGGHISPADAFQKYLAALRGRVGDAKYKSWFVDLGLADVDGDCVTLSTGSEMKRDMIDDRFMPILTDTWRKEIGPVRKVLLTVQKNLSAHAAKIDAEEEKRTRRNGVALSYGRKPNGDLFGGASKLILTALRRRLLRAVLLRRLPSASPIALAGRPRSGRWRKVSRAN